MDFSDELPFASANDYPYEYDYGFPQVPEWQLHDFAQHSDPSAGSQTALHMPATDALNACYENYLPYYLPDSADANCTLNSSGHSYISSTGCHNVQSFEASYQPAFSMTSAAVDYSPDFPVCSSSGETFTKENGAAQLVNYGPVNGHAKDDSHLNGDTPLTKASDLRCERDHTVDSECAARQKQQAELIAAVRERTNFALVHFICDLLEKPACASICGWTGVPWEFHIKSTRTFTDLWNTRNKSQVSFLKIASALKGYENTKIQGYTLLKRVNRGHYRFFPDCECSRLPF